MKKTLLLLTLIPTICVGQWIQIGNDIDGVQANERSGSEVGLNASGHIVVVGAPNNSTNGGASGQARIFEWNGTNWIQKGSLITGDNAGDNLGTSVSINDSGNIIAVGAPGFVSNPTIAGYAKVLQWNGTDWIQMGSNFNGTTADDSYGTSVSINASGSIVAIAAEPFFETSYVRVFEWNGSAWNQLGSDITGTGPQDGFARSISINATGTVLVVGAENIDGPDNANGMLRIYEWNGVSWVQKGNDLFGNNELDRFGMGVSINDNGTIVASGAKASLNGFAGYVKVYEWNGTNWGQKGSTILSGNSSFFGYSNDLSSSGDIIVSGNLNNYAKILQFNGTDWIEIDSLSGESPNDQLGHSVSMNNSGSMIAAGAPGSDSGGPQSGHVRVYEDATSVSVENVYDLSNFTFYPNPTDDFIHLSSEFEVISYNIRSLDGKLILTNDLIQGKEFVIDFSDLNNGIYLLTLQTKDATHYTKIMKN